jgi:hypothetical protein
MMSTSKRGEKVRKIVLLNEVDWMTCLINGRRWERLSIGKNGSRIRRWSDPQYRSRIWFIFRFDTSPQKAKPSADVYMTSKRCLNSLKNCPSQCICRSKNRGRCLHSCRTYYIDAGHERAACWWPRGIVCRPRRAAYWWRSRAYKCIGLFRSCLTNAKSYNVDHIEVAYWPRRGRIFDIDDH